jgi:hypothetical protein
MLEPTPGDPNTLSGGGGGGGPKKGLFDRVKDILMKPKEEWRVIAAEPGTVSGIFTSYVLILAAIGPIAGLIGQQVLGIYGFKPPMGVSVAGALLDYAVQLVAVYVVALIIDALAASFGGTKNSVASFKVAAYASTAYWVAAIIKIVPLLGWVAWIGMLYGWYLLYLGLMEVMKSPQDKAVGYTVVVIVVEVVLVFVFAMIVGMLVLSIFGAAMMAAPAVVRY